MSTSAPAHEDGPSRPATPRTASVLISCYNYGRFVAGAIESALRQTHPVEVIVVDDGSTDDSRAVIERYGDRVQAVFKENGGQAAAINAGASLARGDAVFLLDADDELRPEAVEEVLAAWRPDAVLVQCRPSLMDETGCDVRGSVPAPWIRLDEGDVRERLLATGRFSVTVTSGLAFRRDALLSVLPIPESSFRLAADGFLVRAVSFLGPVQVVDRPLARYRLHGSNQIGGSAAEVAGSYRKYIGWARHEFDAVKFLAQRHGRDAAADVGEHDADYLRFRLFSLVTDPASHPIKGDTRARLLPRLIAAQWRVPAPLGRWMLTTALDLAVSVLPHSLGWRLLSWWYGRGEARGRTEAAEARGGWLTRLLLSESLRDLTAAPDAVATGALSRDTQVALRNAATLAVSLAATWSIGLVVRFWLPRHLGPEGFGLLSFAEGVAATLLACAGLGIDTYIQKEIPLHPKAASDFYGGTVLLRALLSGILVVALVLLPLGGRQPGVRHLFLVFGIGYLLFSLNGSLAALLQANATVDELARANVGTKIAWGIGMGAAILLRLPLVGFAAVFVASEALKLLILQVAARRRLGLQFRVNGAATRAVLLASSGFFANSVAQMVGLRLDVTMLGFLTHDADVGWYGAAQTLGSITLLLTPILAAVLTPLFARAYDRSPEEMVEVLHRALEAIVSVTMPLALFLALGAEIWLRAAFGAAFVPAAGSLRTLAPLFVLIYVSILLVTALVVQGRSWRLTVISLASILVHGAAGLLLVPLVGGWLGPGGAGTGMALAAVAREIFVISCLVVALGHGIIDRQRQSMIARTALAALGTTALHLLLAPLGPWRLLVDLVTYPALAIGVGALQPRSMVAVARELLSERR